jgi:hypothetical protein
MARGTGGSGLRRRGRHNLPGQNPARAQPPLSEACNRASDDGTGVTRDFRSVQETNSHASKNANLTNGDADLHACTDQKHPDGSEGGSDHEGDPSSVPAEEQQVSTSPEDQHPPGERKCEQCRGKEDGKEQQFMVEGRTVWLHRECERFYRNLGIPTDFRRTSAAPRRRGQ